jgi:hypothetical protein
MLESDANFAERVRVQGWYLVGPGMTIFDLAEAALKYNGHSINGTRLDAATARCREIVSILQSGQRAPSQAPITPIQAKTPKVVDFGKDGSLTVDGRTVRGPSTPQVQASPSRTPPQGQQQAALDQMINTLDRASAPAVSTRSSYDQFSSTVNVDGVLDQASRRADTTPARTAQGVDYADAAIRLLGNLDKQVGGGENDPRRLSYKDPLETENRYINKAVDAVVDAAVYNAEQRALLGNQPPRTELERAAVEFEAASNPVYLARKGIYRYFADAADAFVKWLDVFTVDTRGGR